MSIPRPSDDFVTSLLMQDDLLNSERFSAHRRELLQALAEAGRREKRARRFTLVAVALCAVIIALIYSLLAYQLKTSQQLPEQVTMGLALVVILTPLTVLILFLIYFFRYRKSLARIRKQARDETLMEVPRQLAELRKDLETLRGQLTNRTPPSADKGGFTLIEMLVVVAILGILASLLTPTLAGAQARAHTTTCANNLHQIAQALAMYEGDYHYFPGSGEPIVLVSKPPWSYPSTDAWTLLISPYLGSTNVFACPDYKPQVHPISGIVGNSFGYNAGGTAKLNDRASTLGLGYGTSNFVAGGSIIAPSDMLALGDVQWASSVWANYISPWHKQPIGNIDCVVPKRHAGGANMSFADTHIEWAKRPHWIDANNAARTRWNNDHQPHRETW